MNPTAKLFALSCALALLLPACVTVRDCDGNRYRTLKINGMRWMAENLRTTHYADGSPIVLSEVADKDTTVACYFDYGNSRDSVRKYGLLYTWTAAVRDTGRTSTSVQGVCPDGWHLPDDAEWTAMTQGCVAEGYQYRVPFSAQNMRIIKRFVRPPRSGYRYPGNYSKVGEESFWWSSTPSSDGTATGRYLENFNYPCPYVCFGKVYNGYSVRCVQDGAEIKPVAVRYHTFRKKEKRTDSKNNATTQVFVIPHKISKIHSFYSPAEQTQINTWFYSKGNNIAVLNYCVDGLSPTSTFEFNSLFSQYILFDRSKLAYQIGYDSTFHVIDNARRELDIINMEHWQEHDDDVCLLTSLWHYYIPVKADSGLLYCNSFLENVRGYDRANRIRMFTRPLLERLPISNHMISKGHGLGHYPSRHISKDTLHYNYYYTCTINKNLDIIALFEYLDTLYVVHPDGTQESHYFRSKYQKHTNELFDVSILYDYPALNRMCCTQTAYLKPYYDTYRDLYYVIVARAMPADNKDGRRNDAADRPWSLIVLDSAFRQIAEMDMPDCLSKHELMVVPKGIALADKRLSDEEKTCFVILRYNEKDLYNTDIATIRRHSRGANKRK